MTINSITQRRIQYKEAVEQVQIREQAKLLKQLSAKQENLRTQIRDGERRFGKLLEGILQKVASVYKPESAARLAGDALESLCSQRESIKRVQEDFSQISTLKQAQEGLLQRHHSRLERLGERNVCFQTQLRGLRERMEELAREEIHCAFLHQATNQGPPHSSPAVLGSASRAQLEMPMPRGHPEGVHASHALDTQGRSKLHLCVTSQGARPLDVSLVRHGELNLDVQISAHTYGDNRRMWRSREIMREQLERAGYKVQRFTVGMAKRGVYGQP